VQLIVALFVTFSTHLIGIYRRAVEIQSHSHLLQLHMINSHQIHSEKFPVILIFFGGIVYIPNLRGSPHPFTLKGETAVMYIIYPTVISVIFHIMKINAKMQTIF